MIRAMEEKINLLPLHGKYPYSELFWSTFSWIWTEIRIRTPNTDTFFTPSNKIRSRFIFCFRDSLDRETQFVDRSVVEQDLTNDSIDVIANISVEILFRDGFKDLRG